MMPFGDRVRHAHTHTHTFDRSSTVIVRRSESKLELCNRSFLLAAPKCSKLSERPATFAQVSKCSKYLAPEERAKPGLDTQTQHPDHPDSLRMLEA